jgi:hypothetical protein
MNCRRGVSEAEGKKEESGKRGACNTEITEKRKAHRKRKPGEKRACGLR